MHHHNRVYHLPASCVAEYSSEWMQSERQNVQVDVSQTRGLKTHNHRIKRTMHITMSTIKRLLLLSCFSCMEEWSPSGRSRDCVRQKIPRRTKVAVLTRFSFKYRMTRSIACSMFSCCERLLARNHASAHHLSVAILAFCCHGFRLQYRGISCRAGHMEVIQGFCLSCSKSCNNNRSPRSGQSSQGQHRLPQRRQQPNIQFCNA